MKPSKQTAKGRIRMYQPAQKPARGQPQKMRPRNQTNDQIGLPPPVPSPPPAAIFRAVRKLEECKLCIVFISENGTLELEQSMGKSIRN